MLGRMYNEDLLNRVEKAVEDFRNKTKK
jgi:hypothetical protein